MSTLDSPNSSQFEFCAVCSRIYDKVASPHCPHCHSVGAAAQLSPIDSRRAQAPAPQNIAKSAKSRRAYWRGEKTGKRILANALILTCCLYLAALIGILIGKAYSAVVTGPGFSLGARAAFATAALFVASLLGWRLIAGRGMRRNKRPRLSKLQKTAVVVVALGISIIVRTFLLQPFSIPDNGNMPTLLTGDYLLAAKYSYGYSHFSLPFSPPLFSGRIMASQPRPGDLVIFRHPGETSTDRIARIVGLPGDRIQIVNGVLHLNGSAVVRQRLEDVTVIDDAQTTRAQRWRETLSNGVSYETLGAGDAGYRDNTSAYSVPPGHYFVLGDNRQHTGDSRDLDIGYVPFENLIARVVVILWPNVHRLHLSRSAFL